MRLAELEADESVAEAHRGDGPHENGLPPLPRGGDCSVTISPQLGARPAAGGSMNFNSPRWSMGGLYHTVSPWITSLSRALAHFARLPETTPEGPPRTSRRPDRPVEAVAQAADCRADPASLFADPAGRDFPRPRIAYASEQFHRQQYFAAIKRAIEYNPCRRLPSK